jgi:DNA (cytosine-5)-methyltransferase 1
MDSAVEHHAILMRNNSGGAEMTTQVTEYARTITIGGHVTAGQPSGPSIDISDVLLRMLDFVI